MDKSADAFRTISEVAESLETPAHVLRFWESRFPQIKPVKRAGGRRYYRPADVALLGGIRHLLHDEGMTIRGVQKILREQGVRHVAAMAVGGETVEFEADDLDADFDGIEDVPEVETAQVFALDHLARAPAVPPTTPAEVVQLHAAPEPQGIPMSAPAQTPAEEVPEAGHIWVEDDEPEVTETIATPLFAATIQVPDREDDGLASDPAPDSPPPELAPPLSGLAARLRALPRPASPEVQAELAELHSRLGLLQAQMAEALRLRR